MDIHQLNDTLSSLSIEVRLGASGQPEAVGDIARLGPDLRQALRDNRQWFIANLSNTAGGDVGNTVELGERTFTYSQWSPAETLQSPIAIDCETERITGDEIPRLALATVSDGVAHRILHPRQIGEFIDRHHECEYVAHNAVFDFEVIREHLDDHRRWDDICDAGRLHDTMLLDALIRLAETGDRPFGRNLDVVATNYLGFGVNKADPYRLRYGELIDREWSGLEPGFFRYAIKDAIVTWLLYDRLKTLARSCTEPFSGEILPDAVNRFGLLTETVQLRGSIALRAMQRRGVAIDQDRVISTREALRREIDHLTDELEKQTESNEIFRRDTKGQIRRTASGKPSVNRRALIDTLKTIAERHEIVPPQTAATSQLTTSSRFWSQHQEVSPFLVMWLRLEELSKLATFFSGLQGDRIYPRYTTMVRSGRTSCSSPNIQQFPRDGGFRELIVPTPGHRFLAIDYSAIELRTLAAICLNRYGESKLAQIIRSGIDPHSHTAAMFAGVSLQQFQEMPERKQLRQRAKALNFGIPGGLGAAALVSYAQSTYGVAMTEAEAQQFRSQLIEHVYPELSQYLRDDSMGNLALNLRASRTRVTLHFESDGVIGALKRIVRGEGRASDGEPYSRAFANRLWESLDELNANPAIREPIRNRQVGQDLYRQLFNGPVCTLTGRVRGAVNFTQARNTPFQGLAADGAKLALWRLHRQGYRCVAFLHDEVIVELPDGSDWTTEANAIKTILCEAMQELTGDVPIACEFALTDRWYKQAEAVYDEAGRLGLWHPQLLEQTNPASANNISQEDNHDA